ncbi:ribonuclease H-like domain-containing protein [Tanacetum coccineum]|uniref:Ribonuclease H-like domain-containing protein n=1 Tax=Tanacetum coccineum TaxID=301880 RepID=A0ABQ5HVE2_9ASTR
MSSDPHVVHNPSTHEVRNPSSSPTAQNSHTAQQSIITDPPTNTNPSPTPIHPMVTCFCVGTNHPPVRLNLHVSSISLLPKSYHAAYNDPNWQNAMKDKYNALIKNTTWTRVPRPTNANIFRCMWLFRHKYLVDGTLSRYKDRLVANGSTQLEGVDVDETFSMVVKPVTRDSSGMFLSQKKYVVEIIRKAHMVNSNPSRTLIDTESKLGDDGDPVSDLTLYRSLADSLQEDTFTHPDISYAVQCEAFEQKTRDLDMECAKLKSSRLVTVYFHPLLLVAYSDADWLWCPYLSRPFVPRLYRLMCILGKQLNTHGSLLKRQLTLSRSSAEAVYRGVAIDALLRLVVDAGQVRVLYVPPRYQFADIFTKGLPSALFKEFHTSLSVRCPPAPIAKEC